MNFMEYLEQDKEGFLQKLEQAQTASAAKEVVQQEFDRLLLKYNEGCEEPVIRDTAALVIQTARISSGLVDTIGETKVYEERSQGNAVQYPVSFRQKAMAAAGLCCGMLAVLFAVLSSGGNSFQVSNLIISILMMGGAMLSAYLAGKNDRNGIVSSENTRYYTENRIDAQRIYTCMHNVLFAADQDLEQLCLPDLSKGEEKLSGGTKKLSAEEIELCLSLLEALCSEDGGYALDRIRDVKYFLHKNGIEAILYDGTNPELFDFMPSMSLRTFRPALITEEKVLRRGLASGGM